MVTNESLSTLQLDVWILPMIDLISIGIPMNSSSFICGFFRLKYRISVCRQLWWREDRGSWCHCRHRRSRATHPDGVARPEREHIPRAGIKWAWVWLGCSTYFWCVLTAPFFGWWFLVHSQGQHAIFSVYINSACFRKSHFSIFAAATLKLHHLFQGYAVGKVDPLDENVSKSLALQSPTEPIWTTFTLLWPRILGI